MHFSVSSPKNFQIIFYQDGKNVRKKETEKERKCEKQIHIIVKEEEKDEHELCTDGVGEWRKRSKKEKAESGGERQSREEKADRAEKEREGSTAFEEEWGIDNTYIYWKYFINSVVKKIRKKIVQKIRNVSADANSKENIEEKVSTSSLSKKESKKESKKKPKKKSSNKHSR